MVFKEGEQRSEQNEVTEEQIDEVVQRFKRMGCEVIAHSTEGGYGGEGGYLYGFKKENIDEKSPDQYALIDSSEARELIKKDLIEGLK